MLVATILSIIVIGAVSAGFVSVIQSEGETLGLHINHQKAWNIARIGMNRAVKELAQDGNWGDTPATLYQNVLSEGGTYTVTTSNASQDAISIRSLGQVGISRESIFRTLHAAVDSNYPGFLCIDLSSMNAAAFKLQDIYLKNMRPNQSITIDKVRVSGPPETNMMTIIQIKPSGWEEIWNGLVTPGTLVDVVNTTIPPLTEYKFWVWFEPSENLSDGSTYTIEIILADGSSYSAYGIPGQSSSTSCGSDH